MDGNIKLSNELRNYEKDDFIDLIKIFINNPFIDLNNAIYLKKQGFTGDDELYNKFEDDKENEVSIIYINNNMQEIYYKFYKRHIEKDIIKADFKDIAYKYYKTLNYRVLINKEADDNKKDYVIVNNILYLSDMLSERENTKNVIKSFIEQLAIKNNNLFDHSICKSIVDYYIDNKDIKVQDAIMKLKVPMSRYFLLEMNFEYFKRVLKVFFRAYIELNDLIFILNYDMATDDIYKKYGKDKIDKLLNDIHKNNLSDFPRYYI